jgi:translocation and assembly module TamA
MSVFMSAPWLALALLACLALPPAARADIKIEIPDVPPTIDTNIRAFLSLSRYAQRKDISDETIARLQRRIVSETRKALEPLGYYEPQVEYRVTRNEDGATREKQNWVITILVQPGRPVRLSDVSVNVTGPGANERALREIVEAQELKPGLRLNHGVYERVKAELVRAAKNEGYLDAHLTKNELLIDRTERRATAALELETGARYYYGRIDILQDVVHETAMRRLLRMKEGDPYTLESLLRTQYVLDDSLYFSVVEVDSGDPDRQTHTVPITVTAQAGRKNRYAASLGYATDTRVRGKLTWDNRRVNRSGHRFNFSLIGSSVLKQVSARYAIPVMDIALEKLEFSTAATDEELGSLVSKRVELGVGLTEVQGSWQRVLSVTLSREKSTTTGSDSTSSTDDPDNPDSTDSDTFNNSTTFLIIPAISYSTLPSYVIGGTPRPYNLYAELRGSPATLGSDASFLQLRMQGERIFTLSELWSLRVRAELGASWVNDFSDLPASQRFFAGGDRSVRGFGLNELSPKDADGKRIGGRNLFTGSVEIERRLPRNFGAAVFSDVGNAFDHFSDPMEYSAGIGMRWHIAVASLGIDVAQPLSESGRNPRLHLYISTLF